MKFCDRHWDTLREGIKGVRLDHLVMNDRETAALQLKNTVDTGGYTRANFDPLMAAHWMIVNNIARLVHGAGGNLLVLMTPDPPCGGCPLCYINDIHYRTCEERDCVLSREAAFDYMVDCAVGDAVQLAKDLGMGVEE